jgi:hypothetical protein
MKPLPVKYFTHDPQQLQLWSLETIILGRAVCAETPLSKNGINAMPAATLRRERTFIFTSFLTDIKSERLRQGFDLHQITPIAFGQILTTGARFALRQPDVIGSMAP